MLSPTKYKVSTITATGKLNTLIELPVFYQEVELVPFEVADQLGFVYIEYGLEKTSSIYRGFNKKLITPKKKKPGATTQRFDNQVTVILRWSHDQYVNVKVFKNGNVQMTGVKQIEQGKDVVAKVEEQVKRIHERGLAIAKTIHTLAADSYKVCLINSDFRMGMEIRRDRLNRIVQNIGVYSSFEPCAYPGVKIKYCWNSDYGQGDGICRCSCECLGKGTGRGEGQCKNITIAVFQSGCIIITGAQMYRQIDDAYDFIVAIVNKHADTLKKVMPVLPPKA